MTDQSARPALLDANDALFLDLDGTLAPFTPTPDDVRLSVEHIALLQALSRQLGGRLAIITGRALPDLDRILEGVFFPAAGVHGLERRRADGVLIRPEPSPALDEARRPLAEFAEAHPGVLMEDKGLSLT
jgi:trehalose 6-phosphate phosphatase